MGTDMRLHAADSDILPREGGKVPESGSMEAGHELTLRLTTAENDRPTAVATLRLNAPPRSLSTEYGSIQER